MMGRSDEDRAYWLWHDAWAAAQAEAMDHLPEGAIRAAVAVVLEATEKVALLCGTEGCDCYDAAAAIRKLKEIEPPPKNRRKSVKL